MFKKLRNKFLVLNLIIISIVMLLAFLFVYLFTYNNVHKKIDMDLRKSSELPQKTNTMFKEPKGNYNNVEFHKGPSKSFVLLINNDGTIEDYFSTFDIDNNFYEDIKNSALDDGKDTGQFKLDDNYWSYMLQPYQSGFKITFLDTTAEQNILINLIYTFLAVAFTMLIFIFFISKFFANKSIQPIKDAFDKQKQFIADASHELKTPLSVIHTNVDVLLSNKSDTIGDQSKWIYYIQSEVNRMAKLTNDLLYLTQVDYSDIKMIFSNFNISEAIESVLLTMEAVIFENNINLEYDIKPDLQICGNIEQIKQVAMILLDNALKYTPPKGKVSVTLSKRQNNIVFSVTNTGVGIPDEYKEKIFDRFYRIDKSRSRNNGGYGLGLSIAKAIVTEHKGKIYLKGTEEKNTTFTVELPMRIQLM